MSERHKIMLIWAVLTVVSTAIVFFALKALGNLVAQAVT